MLKKREYYQRIQAYYRQSNFLYKYGWYAGDSKGLHFGFADTSTKNHTEALINQYRYVIEKGKIKARMKVLDAGCGVGGATVYIAKKTGASVIGITLVSEQAEEARAYSKKEGVEHTATFMVGDYLKTGLESESFDVVFGIESICYATPKSDFVKEAYRLLKPGGMLVITDGYCRRAVKNAAEKKILNDFCDGWRLDHLIDQAEMTRVIKNGGFAHVKVEDVTDKITMSLNKMRVLVGLWRVGEKLLGWIDHPMIRMARDNAKSMDACIKGMSAGLFGYYSHVARK